MSIKSIQITKETVELLAEEAGIEYEQAEEILQNVITMCAILEPEITTSNHSEPQP